MTEHKLAALVLATFLFAAALSGGVSYGILSDTEQVTAEISVAGNVGTDAGGGSGGANAGNAPSGGSGGANAGNVPSGQSRLVAPSALEPRAAAGRSGVSAVPSMGVAP